MCYNSGQSICSLQENHETWLEDHRYLNLTRLAEQKTEALRLAA